MKSFSMFFYFSLLHGLAAAQTGTNTGAPRAMSLEDCIQEALQHNLDVQIERYTRKSHSTICAALTVVTIPCSTFPASTIRKCRS